MTKPRTEGQNTSWRISGEAKRLLELMAERMGVSQSAVFEQAIRKKAQREKITLDADATDGTSSAPATPTLTPEEKAAVERLRQLAQKVRAGDDVPSEEIQREMTILQAGIPITSAKLNGLPDPEWQERFRRAVETLRAGVPTEWTVEEIQERVRQAVEAVRAERRARGEWPPAKPTFISPQQEALIEAGHELAEATRG